MCALPYIAENLSVVRQEIAEAEGAAGREGRTLMLAAVKYGSDEEVRALLHEGATAVGENRVQQLLSHWPIFESCGAQVHFIGSLQTNKVKYIIDKVAMIHSVDSLRLAKTIDAQAMRRGVVMDVLLEINGAREEAKSGVMPEEAEPLCREISRLSHLRLRGFMTMGPRFDSPEAYQAYFASVKALGDRIWEALALKGTPLYSMGMSESFVPAIMAGADFVRIGRRLFHPADGTPNG
ncbi:MAG: YggS family pyridoxal phosphate-dependent enzyme [Ruminococcaceae bacterium]|nr:YggS family pyridoxal phosphate-dependent enzyme [Oscillospiraceae bacterium]